MAEAQRVTKEVIEQLIRATKRSGSKIKREFRKMDKDKNGKLSTKEFASGLRNLLGVDAATSWDYVNAMMPILDVDGGESLTVKPAGS
jgi:Ca2+-binding EF-hand superfamily protein